MTKSCGSVKGRLKNNPTHALNIEFANEQFQNLKLGLIQLDLPDFGSSMFDLNSNSVFHDADTIVSSTIATRFIKKFELPSRERERELRSAAVRGWVDFEENHVRKYRGYPFGSARRHYNACLARAQSRDILKDFWSHYHNAPLDFGPGESYIGNEGKTSVYDKLDVTLWSVTFDCLDLFAELITRNSGLWYPFLDFCKKRGLTKEYGVMCTGSLSPAEHRLALAKFVLIKLDLVVNGGRGTSVYKSNDARRFINIECFGNVLVQKQIGWAFRQCLKTVGCDLDNGQDYHRALIRNSVTTYDWSNASDSIVYQIPEFLIPGDIFALMDQSRSFTCRLKYEVDGQLTTVDHVPYKLSSMGNGFTFETLTLINLAYGLVFDENVSVYGDDVIISKNEEVFRETMEDIGFVLNRKKSFHNLPFRESCGAFYFDWVGYITCYDFRYCHDTLDVILFLNKLQRVFTAHPDLKLSGMFREVYNLVAPRIDIALCGPTLDTKDIPSWLEVSPSKLARKRRNAELRNVYQTGFVLEDSEFVKHSRSQVRPLPDRSLVNGAPISYRSSHMRDTRNFIARIRVNSNHQGRQSKKNIDQICRDYCYDINDVHIVKIPVPRKTVTLMKENLIKVNIERKLRSYLRNGHVDMTMRQLDKSKRKLNFSYYLITSNGIALGNLKLPKRTR